MGKSYGSQNKAYGLRAEEGILEQQRESTQPSPSYFAGRATSQGFQGPAKLQLFRKYGSQASLRTGQPSMSHPPWLLKHKA